MLYVLQEIINSQLNSRSFRCGCKCLSCCDWVAVRLPNGTTTYEYECYDATDKRPCSPYASCSVYNETECGFLFSTADQVGFCEIRQPPLWPALVQVPRQEYRGPKYPEFMPIEAPDTDGAESQPSGLVLPLPANILYTGEDPAQAQQLMDAMWARGMSITDAAMAAYFRAQSEGRNIPSSTENQTIASEQDFVDAAGSLTRGLYEFGLVMGTSAFTSVTLHMEPAFVASNTGSSDVKTSVARPPLYFPQPNCAALSTSDANTLGRIGEAITNMTGFPVECVSVAPKFVPSEKALNDPVYCGWLSSGCVVRNDTVYEVPVQAAARASSPIKEYIGSLYNWHDTDASKLHVSVWVNNTNVARDPGVPDVQRWAQPINLAANAYLHHIAGVNASARLAGVKDMPKGSTSLSLDFSSLLGPLFMMWFAQLLLPINIYAMVQEKEKHLRIMMRMQGLRDGAYYAVTYIWMMSLYCVFIAIFVAFGSAIGLKIFTLNDYSIQLVFYVLWGSVLSGFSFYFSAWQKEARPAVLLAVIYVIVTGFVANLVLVQYVEAGPPIISTVLEILPAFGLFRGLYEFAQFAFLANRTGGKGLTWSKLRDPGCGMVQVWLYFLIESILFPLMAWYVEQVTGAGTGVKRHPLFFLGMNHAENMVENKKKKEKRGIFGLWRRKKQPKNRQAEQNGKGAGAQLSTSSPGTPSAAGMGPAVTAPKHEEIQSPSLDYYYGPSTQAAAPSPGLLEGLDPEFRSPKDPSHLLAGKPVPRRITSVKLGVVPEDFVDVGVGNGKQDVNGDLDNDEGYDVAAERARVEAMYRQWAADRSVAPPSAILLHNLRKVYPSRGGGPKVAVRSLSLGIERRECFGLLGPNGAGKTTTIRMMEGFLDPTSGAAIIEGYSIPKDVDSIYSLMGACPQHDLLWEGLTGREHLLFYGRIKNLGGPELQKAVDAGLRKVNLFTVGDSLVSNYSGGMKRRLSVAISLMGDPKVVYFDEPSTGLDPSSRRLLWEVIKEARRTKAVVLTTHSMEEAESLCDRLGIFVNGKLQCVGNPKDLTARFGGYLSFTVTTPAHQETAAEGVVRSMAPGARLVYSLGGTQKFELPLREIGVEGVFRRMEEVKLRKELDVMDWGVSNATLEEVFIKITKDAGVKMSAFTQGQGGGAHDLNLNGASSV